MALEKGTEAYVRALGRAFVLAFCGALRNVRMYPAENPVVQRSLQELTALSTELLDDRGELDTHVQPEVFYVDPKKGLAGLQKVLKLTAQPRTIEGVDIAHLGGGETVASLVQFIDGLPFKPNYRRFKIRDVRGVDDYASVGAFSPVHQFCRIGRYAYVGACTVITQDVPPFSRVVTERETRCYGVNTVGLERRGFDRERLETIESAFRLLLRSKLNTSQALERMKSEPDRGEDVDMLIRFIEASERGVIK